MTSAPRSTKGMVTAAGPSAEHSMIRIPCRGASAVMVGVYLTPVRDRWAPSHPGFGRVLVGYSGQPLRNKVVSGFVAT